MTKHLENKALLKTIVSASLYLLCFTPTANSSPKDDEQAIRAILTAADELANDVAKVNKKHSKEYFKKRIGEIFIECSRTNAKDIMECVKPRVQALTKE